jgi:glycosyltransferase involved in cell wall biosynthesis
MTPNETILFSIIIPSFNRGHLIGSTIRSVLAQEHSNWELIIVDDGSTDDTKEQVLRYKDPRILYHYQDNAERSAARNKGLSLSKGEFICFLDSDDQWIPEHLSIVESTLRANNFLTALYFTGVQWNFEDGRKEDVLFEPVSDKPIEYVIKNQIGPSTQCVHRKIIEKHRFDENLRVNEDVELNTRIVNEFPLIQIRKVTVRMLIHEQNTKSLFREYITPQVQAMDKIFHNKALQGKISNTFKRSVQHSFDSQYVMVWEQLGETKKLRRAILRYLVRYPFDKKNKARLVLLLYNLPLGFVLQKTVQGWKRLIKRK